MWYLIGYTAATLTDNKEIKEMLMPKTRRGIRLRYLLKKFVQIVIAKLVARSLRLKLRVMADKWKFAPPVDGKKGGSSYYATELEYEERRNAGKLMRQIIPSLAKLTSIPKVVPIADMQIWRNYVTRRHGCSKAPQRASTGRIWGRHAVWLTVWRRPRRYSGRV